MDQVDSSVKRQIMILNNSFCYFRIDAYGYFHVSKWYKNTLKQATTPAYSVQTIEYRQSDTTTHIRSLIQTYSSW